MEMFLKAVTWGWHKSGMSKKQGRGGAGGGRSGCKVGSRSQRTNGTAPEGLWS